MRGAEPIDERAVFFIKERRRGWLDRLFRQDAGGTRGGQAHIGAALPKSHLQQDGRGLAVARLRQPRHRQEQIAPQRGRVARAGFAKAPAPDGNPSRPARARQAAAGRRHAFARRPAVAAPPPSPPKRSRRGPRRTARRICWPSISKARSSSGRAASAPGSFSAMAREMESAAGRRSRLLPGDGLSPQVHRAVRQLPLLFGQRYLWVGLPGEARLNLLVLSQQAGAGRQQGGGQSEGEKGDSHASLRLGNAIGLKDEHQQARQRGEAQKPPVGRQQVVVVKAAGRYRRESGSHGLDGQRRFDGSVAEGGVAQPDQSSGTRRWPAAWHRPRRWRRRCGERGCRPRRSPRA